MQSVEIYPVTCNSDIKILPCMHKFFMVLMVGREVLDSYKWIGMTGSVSNDWPETWSG